MGFTFELFASTATVIAGFLSVLSTLYTYLQNRTNEKEKLAKAEEVRFEAVLNSNDINVLGRYLDETLGQFNVYEYTSSNRVAERVNKYVQKIQSFVGTTDSVVKEVKPTGLEPAGKPVEGIPPEFQTILDELRTGETWNGLARLRRQIEIKLRNIAQRMGFKERHLKSAGQILRLLFERKYVSPDSYELLNYSISICNRAIHGIDVSEDEAEQAVYLGTKALKSLAAVQQIIE